jgi:hypothetical protein
LSQSAADSFPKLSATEDFAEVVSANPALYLLMRERGAKWVIGQKKISPMCD